MADISNLFKATVKAINSRKKAQDGTSHDLSASILPKKQKGGFELKAKALVKSITELRDFLQQNRKEYVNSGSLLSNHGVGMSESERDQIDGDAQQIIKTCKETIALLRKEMNGQNVYPHVQEHRIAVVILIESYLRAICKIYGEQKAVRVKRVVDRKKISKLEPERKHSHLTRTQLKKDLSIKQETPGESKDNSSEVKGKPLPSNGQPSLALDSNTQSNDDQLSPEEMQMFELENKALYSEMNSMAEEVKQIEGQVVEIAKLQEIFTEKILEQDVVINSINTTTVGTTENIKDANEEIRKAIKKKAEFRITILFFLVVMSLTLLFLDWYNG